MHNIKEKAKREHAMITSSLSSFLRVLADSQLDQKPSVSKEELKEAFNNVRNALILFILGLSVFTKELVRA